jgi:hypothetical protein
MQMKVTKEKIKDGMIAPRIYFVHNYFSLASMNTSYLSRPAPPSV